MRRTIVVGAIGLFILFLTLGMTGKSALAQGGTYIGLEQVTNDDFIDLYPVVSPNSQFIAYMSYQKSPNAGKNFDIFIKEIATGATQRLHDDAADDAFPAWSSDGQAIFFDAYRRVDKRAVWFQKVGGGTVAKVTNIPKAAFEADGHPDGRRVVFTAIEKSDDIDVPDDGQFWKEWRSGQPNLYIINADGSELKDLNIQGINPKWSPDGNHIVFASNASGNFEIYTVRADGSDLLRLTTREANDIEPAWSPDGSTIVFVSNENKNWNLWLIKADGTGLSPLTDHEGFEGGPRWGTDGYIYFHSDRNGNWDIWRLKPSGYKPDRDGDGIPNQVDQCPDDPEDIDGFKDEDGCSDPDNDNDGVLDAVDRCPGDIEDADGFKDEDGCPDPDNDNDGILDKDDRCPKEAENFNFYQDEDGCPDDAPIVKGALLHVTFAPGNTRLAGENNVAVLIALVEGIKRMPKAKIILKVYTDSVSQKANPALTDRRAKALVAFIVDHGINPDQIAGLGMGDAEPVATSRTPSDRAQNNRVVIEVTGK